jgi:hypothetical protein
MTKPDLSKKGENMEVINGQYLPLANKCAEMGTVYTPLNAKFDTKTIVVTGSNMGGKTMLLKTIGFMQVLTQMGFYIPAKKFKTAVFENIHYIGEDLSEKVAKGLGLKVPKSIDKPLNLAIGADADVSKFQPPKKKIYLEKDPALSQANTKFETIATLVAMVSNSCACGFKHMRMWFQTHAYLPYLH